MILTDEFRRADAARGLYAEIKRISKRRVNVMEICGTHTHSISRYGLREALPPTIGLVSGPGCPVCVTSASDVDTMIAFAKSDKKLITAVFGDMMRVPGSTSSLMAERAAGADVRVVYSPLNVLELARANPNRQVVFQAVGFETTAPTVAATVLKAGDEGLDNLSVLARHKLTPPAMKALLDSGETKIDGFICPGHVTAVIGADAYRFLADEYGSPCVVSGFEPLDILLSLRMIIEQIEAGRAAIEVEYDRVVRMGGNKKALEAMEAVFTPADASWRGIGVIPASGLRIRDEFSGFDAEKRFSIDRIESEEPAGCACGEVLKGLIKPPECALFASGCTPDDPVGPCMVSSEGTCAAFYRYRTA